MENRDWCCNVCGVVNSDCDGECQFCPCEGKDCRKDNCGEQGCGMTPEMKASTGQASRECHGPDCDCAVCGW